MDKPVLAWVLGALNGVITCFFGSIWTFIVCACLSVSIYSKEIPS